MKLPVFVLMLALVANIYAKHVVTVKRLFSHPIINYFDIKNSDFLYNYNTATLRTPQGKVYLAVRVQDLVKGAKDIYNVGPSLIALTAKNSTGEFSHLTAQDVIIDPKDSEMHNAGCEDPRIVTVGDTHYMYYTAVTAPKGAWVAKLALATCNVNDDVTKKSNWKLHGPILPDVGWSKSGALLDFNQTTKYLFWGDNSISIATTSDMINYKKTGVKLIETRKDKFDSELCESGPEPLKLSDGNYLFLYNSGRKVDTPNPKPGWHIEYNLGYLILDGKDPTKILQRSDEPILSPELDWERCDNTSGKWKDIGLTPLVIFVEGWVQSGNNRFIVVYQGCDSFTGIVELGVTIQQ